MPIIPKPRATILLVDDDLPLAEMLRVQLTARGYAVHHVVSASEAEDVVDDVAPDLVIIDGLLTDTQGLVLCANLRDRITSPISRLHGVKATRHPGARIQAWCGRCCPEALLQ